MSSRKRATRDESSERSAEHDASPAKMRSVNLVEVDADEVDKEFAEALAQWNAVIVRIHNYMEATRQEIPDLDAKMERIWHEFKSRSDDDATRMDESEEARTLRASFPAIFKMKMAQNMESWMKMHREKAFASSRKLSMIRLTFQLAQRAATMLGELVEKEYELAHLYASFPLLTSPLNPEPERAWTFLMQSGRNPEDESQTVVMLSMIQAIESDVIVRMVDPRKYPDLLEFYKAQLHPRSWRIVFSGHLPSPHAMIGARSLWRYFDMKPDSETYRYFRPPPACFIDVFTLSLLMFYGVRKNSEQRYNYPDSTQVIHRLVVPNFFDARVHLCSLLKERAAVEARDMREDSCCDSGSSSDDEEASASLSADDSSDDDACEDGRSRVAASSSADDDEAIKRKIAKQLARYAEGITVDDVPENFDLPPISMTTVFTVASGEDAKDFAKAVMELVAKAMDCRKVHAAPVDKDMEKIESSMKKISIEEDGGVIKQSSRDDRPDADERPSLSHLVVPSGDKLPDYVYEHAPDYGENYRHHADDDVADSPDCTSSSSSLSAHPNCSEDSEEPIAADDD